ncbi:olfactory receptor 6N2-like [Archocentrus centrarchus]|uniref:olfactory receptor 6N2-like n=1 Tax=Archocentrus centrarchus TaxID=63155 RepID=UPI0011EA0528|nr:olfactory receptor 6N2-like [Archocentrus centrarchus]
MRGYNLAAGGRTIVETDCARRGQSLRTPRSMPRYSHQMWGLELEVGGEAGGEPAGWRSPPPESDRHDGRRLPSDGGQLNEELNVTYITLDGYVEVNKYRYLYFFIMFTLYILIICSNSIIVNLICIHKNLHEPMYIFIAALLLNCVLYSTIIYPKLLIDFLSEKQVTSYSACLFQFFMFYTLGSSEFFLLAAMAYDRYVAICKPLQYPIIMTKTTVSIFLVIAWLVPSCHIAVQAIGSAEAKLCDFNLKGIFCNNAVYTLQCERSRLITVFGVVCLLDLVILPMLFIVFTYMNIFIVSYRSCKEVRKKATETCLPHLLVLISISCLSIYDVSIARVESDFPKTACLIMTLQIVLYHPLFNPFIYGLKMKEISKHLKRLLSQAKIISCINTEC